MCADEQKVISALDLHCSEKLDISACFVPKVAGLKLLVYVEMLLKASQKPPFLYLC